MTKIKTSANTTTEDVLIAERRLGIEKMEIRSKILELEDSFRTLKANLNYESRKLN